MTNSYRQIRIVFDKIVNCSLIFLFALHVCVSYVHFSIEIFLPVAHGQFFPARSFVNVFCDCYPLLLLYCMHCNLCPSFFACWWYFCCIDPKFSLAAPLFIRPLYLRPTVCRIEIYSSVICPRRSIYFNAYQNMKFYSAKTTAVDHCAIWFACCVCVCVWFSGDNREKLNLIKCIQFVHNFYFINVY